MKLLILGLDGGDERVLRSMPMPRLHGLLDGMTRFEPVEDLMSRGWGEVLSGSHGRETGAFYDRPVLGARPSFSQSYRTSDYARNPSVRPLWRLAEEAGLRLGMLGVPTTNPALSVNGFWIAGSGGGQGSGSAVPHEALYPPGLGSLLAELGFIWDTRFVTSGTRDINAFVDLVMRTCERRTEAFLTLCERHRVDVAMVVDRLAVVLQNLARSEIGRWLERPDLDAAGVNERRLVDAFALLDVQIGRIVDSLQPQRLIVVSDHGTQPYLHRINANVLLRRAGLGFELSRGRGTVRAAARRLARSLESRLPAGAVQRLKRRAVGTIGALKTDIDFATSRAFAARYISGVYVNDADRFGGPVRQMDEVAFLTEGIVEAVNGSPEATEHGLSARPYRALHADAPFADYLPDVWIDAPDTVFFEAAGPDFVAPNAEYGPLGQRVDIERNMVTGIKGRHALLFADSVTAAGLEEVPVGDLTDANRLVRSAIARRA